MRKIDKPTIASDDPYFAKGFELATQLRHEFKGGNRAPKTTAHYRLFKDILKRTHKNKCCYCEASLDRQHGDVEHFRPKHKVTDENHVGQKVKIASGEIIDHPGYFWLAYDPDNLLLSCAKCNQASKEDEGELGSSQTKGKWNRFPLDDPEKRACLNDVEISDESPLLVHPLFDTISDHLQLDQDGLLKGKTKKGEMTIRILDLNGENLRKARRTAFREGFEILTRLLNEQRDDKIAEARDSRQRVWEIMNEEVEYTMAYWLGFSTSLVKYRGKRGDWVQMWLDEIIAEAKEMATAQSSE